MRQDRPTERAVSGTGARWMLRRETRAEHEALHRHLVFRPLLEGTARAAELDRILGAFHAFHIRVDEPMLGACRQAAQALGGYRYCPRAPILARDLGRSQPAPAAVGAMPAPASPAAIAGAAYVLDGALLGGAVMAKAAHALTAPGALPEYWSRAVSDGPTIWRAALALIERCDTGAAARADMLASARALFALFAATLEADVAGCAG